MINKSIHFLDKDVIDYRERKRDFYNSEEGEKELFNYLYDHKVFSLIGPDDIQLRNMAIKKLEELGFLDESRIRDTLHRLLQHSTTEDEKLEMSKYDDSGDDFKFDPDRE